MKTTLYCTDVEDKNCVGLQRRYDDEYKRRAVRRIAKNFFEQKYFVLYMSDDEEVEIATHVITSHKGSVTNSITNKTDIIIVDKGMIPELDELQELKGQDIPIVGIDWIIDCMTHQDFRDPTNFIIKTKKEVEMKDPDNIFSKGGTKWKGSCTYPGDPIIYNFILEVDKIENGNIFGNILWETLHNAQTKFKGKVADDSFTFQEYEIISGEDHVSVPSSYTVKLIENRFEGDLKEEESGICGKIEATCTNYEYIPPQLNFSLDIKKREENQIEGNVVYQDKTYPFKGDINEDSIKIIERRDSGDVIYEGKIEILNNNDDYPNFCIKGTIQNNPKHTFIINI